MMASNSEQSSQEQTLSDHIQVNIYKIKIIFIKKFKEKEGKNMLLFIFSS